MHEEINFDMSKLWLRDPVEPRVLAMTLHDRPDEVIDAVFTGLRLPGNRPDVIAVCFDRAPQRVIDRFYDNANDMGIDVRVKCLIDGAIGPRCPSLAWNAAFSLIEEDFAFAMSSDMVLGPRSIDMAFHLARAIPDNAMLVGRAEHSGTSYRWHHKIVCECGRPHGWWDRTMSAAHSPSMLSFLWLFPMKQIRKIGGHDESYMKGLCYDDDDITIRLWRAGTDFIFVDDIMGFHLEHPRPHLRDGDGRVKINERLFIEKYGDMNYCKEGKYMPDVKTCTDQGVGLTFWLHDADTMMVTRLKIAQAMYGNDAPWRAMRVVIK